jgi:hypothetical protein
MNKQIYLKVLFHMSLLGIAISILTGFYDVVFGTLLDVIHFILEVIEMGLDKLIEHHFHTNLQQTQLIVFYIMLVVGGVLSFISWKILVYLFSLVRQSMVDEWDEFKETVTADWQATPTLNRAILISLFLLLNYLASFLLF